jgi:hypothetical protein
MSIKTRIVKEIILLSGRSTMAGTRDGELSMLTNRPKEEALDSLEDGDSISTDHSTSDQDCQ